MMSSEEVEIYNLNQLDEYRGYCLDIKGQKLKAEIKKGFRHTFVTPTKEISL